MSKIEIKARGLHVYSEAKKPTKLRIIAENGDEYMIELNNDQWLWLLNQVVHNLWSLYHLVRRPDR